MRTLTLTQVGSVSAIHRKGVGAVLALWVRVLEHQAVSAQFQGGRSVLACPVLVTTLVVTEEAE